MEYLKFDIENFNMNVDIPWTEEWLVMIAGVYCNFELYALCIC